jgi:hypothetical protein
VLWLPLFIALLSVGFAKLSIVTVNWFFGHRLTKRIIVTLHSINFSLILGFPLLLAYGPGGCPLRLVLDRQWQLVPFFYWPVLISGVFGFTLLVWAAIDFQRTTAPSCLIDNESQFIDLKRRYGPSWQRIFIGSGPMTRVALLPGNEQFTIDVKTKIFQVPRLPRDWNGLSLVQLSDFHFRGAANLAYFAAVCEQAAALKPDLFVFTGDLLDDMERLDWISATLGQLNAPLGQYFILGNHDWYLDASSIRQTLNGCGWIDLASRCLMLPKHASTSVVLCGDETPWMGKHPDLSSIADDAFRILLSHTPDNIHWAREQRIDVMLSGHTHGGQIRLPLLGPVYSPSRYGVRFSAGEFWLKPTLLHVSRGISGREPIRYGCPPEITKLVLRCGPTNDS